MGNSILYFKSAKQKLNIKSSTEVELVGTSDSMPYNLWVITIMGEHGYLVKDNIL